MPPFPFVGWAATDAFAQSHVQTIVDFTKAYLLGVRWVTNPANRQAAIDLLVKNTNTSPDDAAKSYDVIVTRSHAFPTTGVTVPQTFARVLDALAQLKLLTPPLPPPTSFFDNRYVNQAVAELARER